MDQSNLRDQEDRLAQQVLAYLNLSSGAPDPPTLAALDKLFQTHGGQADAWSRVGTFLADRLATVAGQNAIFSDTKQAEAVLDLVFSGVLPSYLVFHSDLLHHQTADNVFNPFFVGRAIEATLQVMVGGDEELEPAERPADRQRQLVERIIRRLNDYVGHRPVPALETRKHEPYSHEWVRPIPLFIRGAGVVSGPYQAVVEQTLKLLEDTDADLLAAAYFDLDRLDELAVDPRAYDFDHPVNKRPNYHFGQWDPHHIDNRGDYRRFVVQHVTLDALMARCHDAEDLPESEVRFEAAAVLAGTILMASGVSGRGPDTHDSNTTLSNLLPIIASYRDLFYERLYERATGAHARRLKREARERKQPFGGARQHLNAQLARHRAAQLEHVNLAKIFARMGHSAAARRQVEVIRVPSARMRCQIDCWLADATTCLDRGDLAGAAEFPAKIRRTLNRAIACGAMVDPWNILGFAGQYSLFPALENSVIDHRVEEMVEVMEDFFAVFARLWCEAAAVDDESICRLTEESFRETADWWRQFAAHEVVGVDAVDPLEAFQAAEHVARCMNLWHRDGAAAGDIKFWAPHAAQFDSPKAYARVIEALLDRDDFVGSMGLLVHWLGQADRIPLEQGDCTFSGLAERWLLQLWQSQAGQTEAGETRQSEADQTEREKSDVDGGQLARKFLDYLEANAEEYWQVPTFQLGAEPAGRSDSRDDELADAGDDDDDDNLFGAAYEDFVYHDSTDDGVEGSLYENGTASNDELTHETERLGERLQFTGSLARLWRLAAAAREFKPAAEAPEVCDEHVAALTRWTRQASENIVGLRDLTRSVADYTIPTPAGDHDSMVEYDRVRLFKESLLERIIATAVEVATSARILTAAVAAHGAEPDLSWAETLELGQDEIVHSAVLTGVLQGNNDAVAEKFSDLLDAYCEQPLLYVPLSKGGPPLAIVSARVRQRGIQDLMCWLPRMGFLVETCELIETAREMERNNPVGPGAVTEFDELFKIGYKAIVESLVTSAQHWNHNEAADSAEAHADDDPSGAADAEQPDAEQPDAEQPDAEQPDAEEEAGEEQGPDEATTGTSSASRSGTLLGEDHRDNTLVTSLEQLTESLLVSWLAHSRTLRLSVLENVQDRPSWKELVEFIETYGDELFTQRFLNLGNVRAILHQGVEMWLRQLQTECQGTIELRLLDDLGDALPYNHAVDQLSLVLEAIIENYAEYRDYNSTTTQSDRGELLFTLLDFLRLRTRYDRVCWNLKPVVLAHDILVRNGMNDAARLWRRSLSERISDEADSYLKRLKRLQKKYAMQMPTVADRLGERFVRPLAIDRMRALIKPAIEGIRNGGPTPVFDVLEHEAEVLTREPTGVGLDVPAWILALADEVDRHRLPGGPDLDLDTQMSEIVPREILDPEYVAEQLDLWSEQQ